MTLDSDLAAFFSDQGRLTQIDHLHRLIFQWTDGVQEELIDRIRAAMDELATRHNKWKRHDEKPTPKAKFYEHVGFIPGEPIRSWPQDLLVHFGGEDSVFESWVGVYTRKPDETLFSQIRQAIEPILESPIWNLSDEYPVYEKIDKWPTGFSDKAIKRGASVADFADLLKDGNVLFIQRRIEAMLDALERSDVARAR